MPKHLRPLSVAEVHQETGIARRTIQRALTDGDLKAHKFPGKSGVWLIERGDLMDWLQRRRTEALRNAHPKASA